MNGPCAKQTTRATIVAPDGRRFVGTNDCRNPQTICPRGDMPTGQGYELCASICQQTGHAEANACRAAGQEAHGGVLYLEGHYYACVPCAEAARKAGVRIQLSPPPPCFNCDDSGDLHGLDGEWLGLCAYCKPSTTPEGGR